MHDSLCPFSIFSSGDHFVKPKGTILAILVKGHEEHFCEIILKSGHRPKKRYCLKVFLFFSSGGNFVQWSRTILAILIKGH